ncbi:MAG: hypothetical protein ACJAS1_002549 [Oleiphilaceae bacterium]|jgi:hypothetical protein
MKELKNFKKHYLTAANKLALALLMRPESAKDICQLSTKRMLVDLEVDNGVDVDFFKTEYINFCQLIWKDMISLINFYLMVESNSAIRINSRMKKSVYIKQADKVYCYVINNMKSPHSQFSDLASSLLGEIHYRDHVKNHL